MSKTFDFRFLPSALRDIEEVFSYITVNLCNQKAANDLMDKLDETIDNVRLFPQSFPLHEDKELANKAVRKVPVGNFMLFYTIDEAQRVVKILYFKFGGSNLSELTKNLPK